MLSNLRFARKRHNRKESLIQEYKIRPAVSTVVSKHNFNGSCCCNLNIRNWLHRKITACSSGEASVHSVTFPGFTRQKSADGHNMTRVLKYNTCSKTAGEPDNVLLINFFFQICPYFKVEFHIDNYF